MVVNNLKILEFGWNGGASLTWCEAVSFHKPYPPARSENDVFPLPRYGMVILLLSYLFGLFCCCCTCRIYFILFTYISNFTLSFSFTFLSFFYYSFFHIFPSKWHRKTFRSVEGCIFNTQKLCSEVWTDPADLVQAAPSITTPTLATSPASTSSTMWDQFS
jgi:hypothetical protein